MFRRQVLLAVALLLAMLLQACGSEPAPTATPVPPAVPTATTAPATDATAPPAAATDTAAPPAAATDTAAPAADNLSGTVTFWTAYNTVSPENKTLTEQIIPAFEKLHPNVTVKAQALPYDDLRQKLLAAVAGGETPDLVRADIIWVPEFGDLGALAPLDQEMPDFASYKDQVYAGPLATNYYKGHYYGLPLDTNTRVIFYHPDVFKAAGITDAPKTFDDFAADCAKIKALGKADTYCYAEGGTGPWNILPWIWSNGGNITDPTYSKATGFLNSKASVDAVNMLNDWLKQGYLSPSIMGGGIATSDAMGKGQVGMIVDGPWMPPIFQQQYPDLKTGLAAFPSGPGGSVSVVGGEDIVMFEKSQNKAAALAFMRYMLNTESQTALGKVGQMPVLKSLTGSKDLPDYYAVFQQQLETAQPRTPSPAWPKIDDAINTAVQEVLRGEKTAQAAMDEAAGTVDKLLAGQPVEAAPTPTTAAAAPDNLSGTVTFWNAYNTVSPENKTLTEQIIPAFEKLHPNVTVKAQALPYDDLRQKLLAAVAGGETPDLVRADIIWVPEFGDLGALAPLDQEMPDFATYKDQVYAGPLATNFYGGHYYGLPLDTNTRVIFYHPDVFKAAGIADPPKTFDDFAADCAKIKALGKADTYCYAEGGTGPWNILPWIWSNGGNITDPTYTKATGYLNSKASVDAVNMLNDWLKKGYLSPSIMGGGIATSDAMGKGQVGMIVDGPWMPPIFQQQYPDLKTGLAAFPSGPGGSVSVVGGEDIVMFEKSQNKAAALAFMRYMLNTESQTALGKVGQMPVLKSLTGSKDLPDYYAVFQQQLETAQPRTPSPAWPKIDDTINTAVQQVLRGEKTAQAAMDEAAAAVDKLLAGTQ